MKNDLISNTTTRLPIVLCLDISPSMSWNHRIENLNKAIGILYDELISEPKTQNSVEVAVVTFSTKIEENTEFELLNSLKGRTFTTVPKGGTNLSTAVLKSIEKLERRLEELDDAEIDHYLPYLVLVTDGDPDETDNKENLERAIRAVREHCELNGDEDRLIAPYIIGVGEQVSEESLNRFAEKFTGKAIIIDDNTESTTGMFKELFAFIGNSVCNSLRGAGNLKGMYENIQKASTKKTEMLHRKRKLL